MKRPAGAKASESPLKKPAACGESTGLEAPDEEKHVELTAEAVKDHNKFCEEAKDMSVEQFEKALSKLDDKASQRLWKAFEVSRKSSGADKVYQEATETKVGQVKKKRAMLLGWIRDGKKPGEHFKACVESVSLKKTQGLTSTWLTQAQAMTHWGKEELQERVKSGTVKARKDPQDSRYWQFKACQEHEAVEVERKKEARFEVKKKAEQKEVTDVWKAKHLEYLTEDDFNLPSEDEGEDDEDSDELPAGLAEALGTKSNKEKKDKKEKKEKKEKKDKWEEMTEVQEGEGPQKVKDRLMAFKVELTKDLANLEALLHTGQQLSKPMVKDAKQVQVEGQQALKKVTALLKASPKKAAVTEGLKDALLALKGMKSKKVLLAKALKA